MVLAQLLNILPLILLSLFIMFTGAAYILNFVIVVEKRRSVVRHLITSLLLWALIAYLTRLFYTRAEIGTIENKLNFYFTFIVTGNFILTLNYTLLDFFSFRIRNANETKIHTSLVKTNYEKQPDMWVLTKDGPIFKDDAKRRTTYGFTSYGEYLKYLAWHNNLKKLRHLKEAREEQQAADQEDWNNINKLCTIYTMDEASAHDNNDNTEKTVTASNATRVVVKYQPKGKKAHTATQA